MFSSSRPNFIKISQVALAQSVTPFCKTGFWENTVKVFVDRKVLKNVQIKEFLNFRMGILKKFS